MSNLSKVQPLSFAIQPSFFPTILLPLTNWHKTFSPFEFPSCSSWFLSIPSSSCSVAPSILTQTGRHRQTDQPKLTVVSCFCWNTLKTRMMVNSWKVVFRNSVFYQYGCDPGYGGIHILSERWLCGVFMFSWALASRQRASTKNVLNLQFHLGNQTR